MGWKMVYKFPGIDEKTQRNLPTFDQNVRTVYPSKNHVTTHPDTGNPRTGTFTNSEDPDEMPHNAAFHLGQHCLSKKSFRQKITILIKNYNQTPLNMCNGLSQVFLYQIRKKYPIEYKGLNDSVLSVMSGKKT